jgi:hypothetical protein
MNIDIVKYAATLAQPTAQDHPTERISVYIENGTTAHPCDGLKIYPAVVSAAPA